MTDKTNYFKIGIFVLVAIAMAIVAILALGAKELFRKEVLIETYFNESVQGLEVGSPIKYRGIALGKVKSIQMVSTAYDLNNSYVMVVCSIYSENIEKKTFSDFKVLCKEMIEKGLRVRLASQGLTGVVYLEVDYFDPNRFELLEINWKPRYFYLPSVPSAIARLGESLERIMNNLEQINIHQISKNLESLLLVLNGKIQNVDIKNIGRQTEMLLSELRESNKKIKEILEKEETERIITDTSKMVAGARRIVEKSEKPLTDFMSGMSNIESSITKLSEKIEVVADDLPELSEKMQKTLTRLDNLVAAEKQDIEIVIRNFKQISEDLAEITSNSRRYPAQTFFGDPPPRIKMDK
jgi:phospholipid/cholesterol/gamma-HCH transport system substrate-binding protein/paraquat-inducible protein B